VFDLGTPQEDDPATWEALTPPRSIAVYGSQQLAKVPGVPALNGCTLDGG